MEDAGTGPSVDIDCCHTGPHDTMGHLDKSWSGFNKVVHQVSPGQYFYLD
jgi:hypothetical protein